MVVRISFAVLVAGAVALAVGFRAAAGGSGSEAPAGTPPTAGRTAGELVRLALQSEVAGNDQRRDGLLREALYAWPNDPSVHWQMGYVRMGGRWLSPGEVELSARGDKRLGEYSHRRNAEGPSATDHAALARWCRKNRLDEQQRAEWRAVLQAEPANPEAVAALRLRPYLGTLMTPTEVEQAKGEMRLVARAADAWKREVVRWRDAAERGEARLPAAVAARVAGAADAPEFLGLEPRPLAAGRPQTAPPRPPGDAPRPDARAGREFEPGRGRVVGTVLAVFRPRGRAHRRSHRTEAAPAGTLRPAVYRGAPLAVGSAGPG